MLFGDIHTSVPVCKLKFIRLSINFKYWAGEVLVNNADPIT